MARPVRVDSLSAVCRVLGFGSERRVVSMDDHDRERFLDTLGGTAEDFGVRVHACCCTAKHGRLIPGMPRDRLASGRETPNAKS